MARTVRGWAVACAAVLAVAGCAPAAEAPAPQRYAGDAPTTHPAADCTRASKATIVEKSGGDAFTPSSIKLQRGAFLAVVNKSGDVHELVAKPGAGLVTSVLDKKERQVIQFPEAGTFTVTGAAGATLRVAVSGDSGCGVPKPTLTINNGYAFAPAKLTVAPTINFTVVNKSSAAHALTCNPDTGGNRDHSRLEPGETQILAIDEPGTYTCHSVQHPDAKVVIKVAG